MTPPHPFLSIHSPALTFSYQTCLECNVAGQISMVSFKAWLELVLVCCAAATADAGWHTREALNMNLLKEFIKRCLLWCMLFWACCDKIASSYISWNEQNVANITLIHKENYVHPFLCDRWIYMGSAPCKYKSRNQAFNTLHFDVSNLTVDVHHIGSLH